MDDLGSLAVCFRSMALRPIRGLPLSRYSKCSINLQGVQCIGCCRRKLTQTHPTHSQIVRTLQIQISLQDDAAQSRSRAALAILLTSTLENGSATPVTATPIVPVLFGLTPLANDLIGSWACGLQRGSSPAYLREHLLSCSVHVKRCWSRSPQVRKCLAA